MLYFLIVLWFYTAILGFLGIIPYSGWDILISTFFMVLACKIINQLIAGVFKVSPNIESSLISGLILSLIIGPLSITSFQTILIILVASTAAMASKYVLTWRGRHIFNPAATGALVSGLVLHQGASWWVGSIQTLPVILIGGLMILKKIRRFQLVGTFLIVALLISRSFSFLIDSPILFFSMVMLIEPSSSPYKRIYQIIYAVFIALAFNILTRFVPIPLETSLLLGNIIAFVANKSFRQKFKLIKKVKESEQVTSFRFEPERRIDFEAGQYLEYTLAHQKPDNRGIRRFFTISASPTEGFLQISTRFAEKSSTFKLALKNLEIGDKVTAANLEGDFALPKDAKEKLCFIAGGIGITPFRSMIKYLLDKNEERDIILLYSVKTLDEVVFKDLFDKAKEIGVEPIYISTDSEGYVDEAMIKDKVKDWKERTFFVSGPEPMVETFEKMLRKMGLPGRQIKTDFFPGYN